jgi:two-component system, cell cycle response regulator
MANSKQALPVLVVDDSRFARKLVVDALSAEQYSVLQAGTGREALDLFATHRPPMVITDWLMPDLGGADLCVRLRADFEGPYTYIVILTGNAEKPQIVRGLQAGADDYLTKPFHTDELLARVAVGRRIIELHREIEGKNRLLEQLALTDGLTGLPNRRAAEEFARRQLNGASRHGFNFWVVMADVDHFKNVNDTCGHDAGDIVLKKFAEIFKANIRNCDICCRFGGEEFLMIVTHVDETGIALTIERIRRQLEEQRFSFGGREVTVTASFGIAGLDASKTPNFDSLVAQADKTLYSAKQHGRNRTEIATRI